MYGVIRKPAYSPAGGGTSPENALRQIPSSARKSSPLAMTPLGE